MLNGRGLPRAAATARRLSPLLLLAILWLAVADIPTQLRLGPLSVSGAATLLSGLAAVVLAPVLLLHGRTRSAPRSWDYVIPPGPRRGVVPIALVLFCAIAVVGLARHSTQNAIQQVSVYCAFAAAIGFGALYSNRSTADRFLRALGLVMALIGLAAIPLFLANVLLFSPRAFALSAMVGVAALVPYRSTNLLVRLAPYALTLGIAASLSRTALAISVLLLAFAILRSRHGMRGARIVLALVALAVVGVVAFLAVPSLRDRFTTGDNGVDIGGVELNTSGRTQIWALVIQDAQKNVWFGLGPGSASDAISARYPFIAQPHNDYLRLWHDFGLIGAGLFVIALLALVGGALRRALQAPSDQRAIHWGAMLGLLTVAASALTDNPLIYPFVMIPLGMIVGLSIGRRDVDLPAPRGRLVSTRATRRPAPPRPPRSAPAEPIRTQPVGAGSARTPA